MLENGHEYLQVLDHIKREITTARARVAASANAEVVRLYWTIGHILNSNNVYGTEYISSLAKDLRVAFPGLKGFSARSMRYMAKFAREVDPEFCNSCCKIPWGHITHLLDKTEPGAAREWYVHAALEHGWSRAVLVHQIELGLYERQQLSGAVTNFERTLPSSESELAQQSLKDPYIFDFITAKQDLTERDIEEQMVDNVTKLLLELGCGFAFVGRQYHVVVGDEDFYIDLLFYHARLHCYMVVELKNEKFKQEFTGQLSFYITAVDRELAGAFDSPTIGLLLCKTKNKTVAEYSLEGVDQPIGVSEYRLKGSLPEEYVEFLPSPEDLEARL